MVSYKDICKERILQSGDILAWNKNPSDSLRAYILDSMNNDPWKHVGMLHVPSPYEIFVYECVMGKGIVKTAFHPGRIEGSRFPLIVVKTGYGFTTNMKNQANDLLEQKFSYLNAFLTNLSLNRESNGYCSSTYINKIIGATYHPMNNKGLTPSIMVKNLQNMGKKIIGVGNE